MRAQALESLAQAVQWQALDVRRGSIADVVVPIEASQEEWLVWQFTLEQYDVGFQILENGVALKDSVRYIAAAVPTSEPPVQQQDPPSPLPPARISRCGSEELRVEAGMIRVKHGNVFTLRWDNTYSLVRRKHVRYRFVLVSKSKLALAERAACDNHEPDEDPLFPFLLPQPRTPSDKDTDMERNEAIDLLERSVTDVVSIFMTRPDSPLHEGSIRAFILAMEAVLRHGIKDSFAGAWPEEPYYTFLLEAENVLRDDHGIVAEVRALTPTKNFQFIGWTQARSFLFLALNKNILHYVIENLTKRRMLVEKYYKPHALLFDYGRATRVTSFLSALNAVKFLLAPSPDLSIADDEPSAVFPHNLLQRAPHAAFTGCEAVILRQTSRGDSAIWRMISQDLDAGITQLQNCTLPRYILYGKTSHDLHVGRGSAVSLPLLVNRNYLLLVMQVRVFTQDVLISLTTDDDEDADVIEPIRIHSTDMWVEMVVRFEQIDPRQIFIRVDNSYSLVRTKQVKIRYAGLTDDEYTNAWGACAEMAQTISWKRVAMAGINRSSEHLTSVHLQDEQDVILQNRREGAESESDKDGLLGYGASLITKPVSYLVGGLISSEGGRSACDQCLSPFSFFSRQYVCPSCRTTVCIRCSRHYAMLHENCPEVKTCDRCFIKVKDRERKRILESQGRDGSQSGECAEYIALRRDPTMEKYFKMLGFGVPTSGVAQKMMQDEVSADKIAVFSAGPTGQDRSKIPLASLGDAGARRGGFRRRSSSLRKVHWTSLENKKANDTIWTRATARRKTAPIFLSPQDFQDLENHFGNTIDASSREPKISNGSKKQVFSALDSRRSNNISIGLSQFKSIGGIEMIVQSIRCCDFSFLTTDRLQNIYDISPNSIEMKRYADFRGSRAKLGISEKFLVEMCTIPRVTDKLGAMLFASQFDHMQKELRSHLDVITQACREILHCERLARCFELVLAVGNLLNAGTELADAHGITLGSLLKLSETKSIDRSMTLLQFIVRLIHDRGEGDVLCFINELRSLTDAKRFSNLICVAQLKNLQQGIAQLELEIKEEIRIDMQRFDKDEAKRKQQIKIRRSGLPRHPKQIAFPQVSKDENSADNPRSALLNAIRKRTPDDPPIYGISQDTADITKIRKGNSHQALLASIRARENNEISTGTQAANEPEKILPPVLTSSHLSGRSALLNAIRKRDSPSEEPEVKGQAETRAQLLASIASMKNSRDTDEIDYSTAKESPKSLQAAHLAAIRSDSTKKTTSSKTESESSSESTSPPNGTIDTEKFIPREYSIENNKFITIMRDRLMTIKAEFEDLELETETMISEWEATARYLGEDGSTSTSEYVFSMLNRFVLDVKVAKSLLFRKGMSFSAESSRLLPNAHVGSAIATVFGPGVITALRIVDAKIEIKFPWNREAYLSPSCVLGAGALVRCESFGVGIIRETHYDSGFCSVRFPFGVGTIRVQDIVLETSSSTEQSRQLILQSALCMGDPVLTPFGCGSVESIQMHQAYRDCADFRHGDGIVAVRLIWSDADAFDKETAHGNSGIAFVQLDQVQLSS